jgi:predicted phage terminase large subunit-like protein
MRLRRGTVTASGIGSVSPGARSSATRLLRSVPDQARIESIRGQHGQDDDGSEGVNSRNTPIVIIMQRLHERDLCGYLQDNEGDKWTILSLPSIKDDGTALWEFKHTIEELNTLRERNPIVFERQHLQRPMPVEGRLYKTFKTYEVLPPDAVVKKCVIDTADTGNDYLCSIVYIATRTACYLVDVYYDNRGMEVTEIQTASQLTANQVRTCKVESNNGGRGFARNIERICREQNNQLTKIEWFHQKDNKHNRIFTRAAEVQNMIYYPAGWESKWSKFASAVKSYAAQGKNAHDDAPDCLTLIIETEYTKNNIYIT